jgi:hypothetical protein
MPMPATATELAALVEVALAAEPVAVRETEPEDDPRVTEPVAEVDAEEDEEPAGAGVAAGAVLAAGAPDEAALPAICA